MYRALLVNENAVHAQHLCATLARRGISVVLAPSTEGALSILRKGSPLFEFVILAINDRSRTILRSLRELQRACRQQTFSVGPLFLCISRIQQEPEFQLQIERLGARYVVEG